MTSAVLDQFATIFGPRRGVPASIPPSAHQRSALREEHLGPLLTYVAAHNRPYVRLRLEEILRRASQIKHYPPAQTPRELQTARRRADEHLTVTHVETLTYLTRGVTSDADGHIAVRDVLLAEITAFSGHTDVDSKLRANWIRAVSVGLPPEAFLRP
jgi:hypothetical protein